MNNGKKQLTDKLRDGLNDGRTDERTDGRTDERTDGRTGSEYATWCDLHFSPRFFQFSFLSLS